MQRPDILPLRACTIVTLALSFIAVASSLYARPSSQTDPRTILSRADSALRSIRSASSHGRWLYKSSSNNDTMVVSGRTIFVVDSLDRELGARVRIELDDGRIYTYQHHHLQLLISEEKKMFEVDSAEYPEGFITGDFCGELLPPYGNDSVMINAREDAIQLEHAGTEVVSGALCHKVKVSYPDDEYFASHVNTLYIGVEDHLLRRSRSEYLFGGGPQWQDRIISYDEIGITPSSETFTQRAPEGFTVEDYKRPRRADRPTLLTVGSDAPDWTLADERGDSITLSKLRGKVTLLDFWYSTCGPCIAAMPGVQKLHERFRDRGVVVIGMNALESGDPVAVMKRMKLTYRLALRADSVAKQYQVTGYPTFYIIGVDGKVIHRQTGYGKGVDEEIGAMLDRYLKERGM